MSDLMSYFAITLDPESQALLQPLAIYPIVRGDHVTLAYVRLTQEEKSCIGPNPNLSLIPGYEPAWLLGYGLGSRVLVQTLGWLANSRIQVLKVAVNGSSYRAWDQGVLHITLSHQPETQPVEANQLLAEAIYDSLRPVSLDLWGVICWHLD